MQHEFLFKDEISAVSLEKKKEGTYLVKLSGRVHEVDATIPAEGLISMLIDGRSVLAYTVGTEKGCIVCIGGVPYELGDPAAEEECGEAGLTGDGIIKTPMPGKIVAVHVKEGDAVEMNQPLLVVESMKMQNEILSDVKGVVKKVHFKAGEQSSFGDSLVEIEVEQGE